jgi:SAM-dependent methyltransferase
MKNSIKKNVAVFDADVMENGGYRYTSNAPFSSIVANQRLTRETYERILSLGDAVKTVIDVGCGDGTFTLELAKLLPGVSFTGFDPAKRAIESVNSQSPNCTFFVGDVLDAETFPDKKYDLAIMRGVIHHLPTQKEAIANAFRLSRRLLILEPNGNNPILKVIEKTSKYHIEHEEQSFSSDFFLRTARELNVKVVHYGYVGFVPFFFPTVIAKVIYFFQPMLERIPVLVKYFSGQLILLLEQSPPTGTDSSAPKPQF